MIGLSNIKAFGIEYKQYFVLESIDDLQEYYEIFRKPQVHASLDNLRNNTIKTALASYSTNPLGFIITTTETVYESQLKMILQGKKVAVNQLGGYFALPNDAIIKHIVIKKQKLFKSKFER